MRRDVESNGGSCFGGYRAAGKCALNSVIETARLILRPFELSDAGVVRELAGHRKIAETTLRVPHPYEAGMAESWIESLTLGRKNGGIYAYAICKNGSGGLLGTCSLAPDRAHRNAEISYWIGVPFWNMGFGTEACRAMICEGFNTLDIDKIYAVHFASNPASGRLMQKIGMKIEGVLRQHVVKWDVPQDLVYYGILRKEFDPEDP